MNHTYDSLRELACLALTTPSLEAEAAQDVLEDALSEAGVWLSDGDGPMRPGFKREWVQRWAMKAAYGPSNVDTHVVILVHHKKWTKQVRWSGMTIARGFDNNDHRKWAEERIAVRRLGGTWRCKSSKAV